MASSIVEGLGLGRPRQRRRGKKKSRVRLRIPPTIWENDAEDEEDRSDSDSDVLHDSIVDLSILENDAEEACRQRYSRSQKKKHIECWDDSDGGSDASATSHDSLLAHSAGKPQKPKDMPKRFGGRRARRQQFPLAKVQTIERILDRIGSGSSFNSSEGPSDTSKHNMALYHHHHHRGAKGGPKHGRNRGTSLKLLLKTIFKI